MHNLTNQKKCLEKEISKEHCRKLRLQEIEFLGSNLQNKEDISVLSEAIWEYVSDYKQGREDVRPYTHYIMNLLMEKVNSIRDLNVLDKEMANYKKNYPDYENNEEFLEIERFFSQIKEREKCSKDLGIVNEKDSYLNY